MISTRDGVSLTLKAMLKETKKKRIEKTNQRETLSQNINLPMVPLAETKANILAGAF